MIDASASGSAIDQSTADAAAEGGFSNEADEATMPTAMRGRWGLVELDCTGDPAAAKGLIAIDATGIKFYESRAEIAEVTSRSDDAIMQLLRLAAGLTARVQSSQLTALSAQMGFTSETGNVAQNTALALPFWFNGNVELIDIDIDREPPSSVRDDPQRLWNLRMRFDLEAHGELLAFASLRGKAVAASLWASEARTMLRVNEALVSVSDNLNQLGLDVQSLHCRVGLPDEWPTHTTINLLDTTS